MDLTAIRNALAAQITAQTGLRALGQARDSIAPPVAVILPGSPFITFGADMSGSVTIGLAVLIIVSDAQPVEGAAAALDVMLSTDPADTGDSVLLAVESDPTLGGAVAWCQPLTVSQYGRIEWAGVPVFGARLNLTVGAS